LGQLLEHNAYSIVTLPRVGDVVVYRDPTNDQVVHTGLVRVAGADGLVLVESKWGWMGRYLHAPLDQPYGGEYVFYRSSRPGGHQLRGLRPALARMMPTS
jgi:hypothetical protein